MSQINPYKLGCRPSPKDKRDLKFAKVSVPIDETKLPLVVYNPVKIHTQWLGSCTGFSMATVISGISNFENQKLQEFSGRWVYGWNKIYDGVPNQEGSYTRLSYKTAQKNGVPIAQYCPIEYVGHSEFIKIDKFFPEATDKALDNCIGTYMQIEIHPGLKELKQAIAEFKFATLTVEWKEKMHLPVNYIAKNEGQFYGYHAICCCGYITAYTEQEAVNKFKNIIDKNQPIQENGTFYSDMKTWLILANSFGESWSYKGFCLLLTESAPVIEAWTATEDMPDDWRNPPVKFKYGSREICGLWLKDWLYACYRLKRIPTDSELYALAYGQWHIEAITGEDKLGYIYYSYMTKSDFNRLRDKLTGKISDIITLRKEGYLLRLPLQNN